MPGHLGQSDGIPRSLIDSRFPGFSLQIFSIPLRYLQLSESFP